MNWIFMLFLFRRCWVPFEDVEVAFSSSADDADHMDGVGVPFGMSRIFALVVLEFLTVVHMEVVRFDKLLKTNWNYFLMTTLMDNS